MANIGVSAYLAAYILPAIKQKQSLARTIWAMATIGGFLIAGTRFFINDDVFTAMALQAGYTTPYIGKLFALFLSKLYTIIPGLPWYGLALLAGNAIAFRMILSIAETTNSGRNEVFAFIFTGLLIYSPFIFEITFTSSSFATAITGILWFSAKQRAEQVKNRHYFIISATLITSFMFRPNAGIMALFSFAPLLFIADKKHLLKIALAIIPFGMLLVHDHFASASTGIEYTKFNELRSKIHDRPESACNYEDALNSTPWSQNDFEMFKGWFYQHEHFLSTKSLETLTNSCNKQFDNQNISRNTEKIFFNNISFYAHTFCFILLVLYFLPRIRFQEAALFGVCLLIIVYLVLFRKLPERIFAPVLYGFILHTLSSKSKKQQTGKWIPIAAVIGITLLFNFRIFSIPAAFIILLLLLNKKASKPLSQATPYLLFFFIFAPLVSSKQKNQERDLKLHRIVTNTLIENKCSFAYAVPGGYDYSRCISPLEIIQYPATTLFLSWQTFSTYYNEDILKKNGFEKPSDTWKFFIDNPKACFIYPKGEPEKLEMFKQFYREHYNAEIDTVLFYRQETLDFFWIKQTE